LAQPSVPKKEEESDHPTPERNSYLIIYPWTT
jgi:hypothetical protein